MLRVLIPTIALLLGTALVQPAAAQGAADLVKQAVAAQGGADALRALKTIAIKGDAKFWEPGQSFKPGGEPRFLGDATFVGTGDFAKEMARIDWDRDQKYPAPIKMKYSEVFTPTLGFVTDEKGSQPMSGIRQTAQFREILRGSPTLMLYALDHPKDVVSAGKQKLGKQSLPAIALTVGPHKFTVLFDGKTHLPAAVRTRDDDNIFGDSNYDMVFGDWKAVGGVQFAHSKSSQINGVEIARLTYKEIAVNPAVAADTFAASDAVKAAAKPPATANVPYQWVIRRIFLTRFLDSDGVFIPAGGSLKLVELAPNVQHVQGGTANNLIVAMKDHLIVFDAPYGEAQSKWVIDAAKAKYPGKPIKYLVLTHHHMDHTGGMRTYVADGATVVVPKGSKALFEADVKGAHTIVPDAQQKAGKRPKIVEVSDVMSLKDDTAEVRLHLVPNPHVDGMIIGHVVQPNVVFVTDLWSPGRDTVRTAGNAAVAEWVKKAGISGATFVGGHGASASQTALDGMMAAK